MSDHDAKTKADGAESLSTAGLGAWLPIETAPEGQWIITFADWSEFPHIAVCRFKNERRTEQVLESESVNAKGRRKIFQEVEVVEREWEGGHWEPTHWMPLPETPNV